MIRDSKTAEQQAVLAAAQAVCAAARTAPKAKGTDYLDTLILTGEEKDRLADKMDEIAAAMGAGFFSRDAGNVRAAQAVVLIGTAEDKRGLGRLCGYCHFDDCAGCAEKGGACVYDFVDLGIALGSAAALAADLRMDNRILFSAGRAAREMNLMDEKITAIFALPLSVSGKSPFFDRKK